MIHELLPNPPNQESNSETSGTNLTVTNVETGQSETLDLSDPKAAERFRESLRQQPYDGGYDF